MPNAMQPFINPEVPLPDIAGALSRSFQMRNMANENALYPMKQQVYQQEIEKNAMALGEEKRKAALRPEEERRKKLIDKYAPLEFQLLREYDDLKRKLGSREAAIKEMQPTYEPLRDQARKDGLPASDTFNPEAAMQGQSDALKAGFLRQDQVYFQEGERTKRTIKQEAGKDKRVGGAGKPAQKDKDIATYARQYNVDEDTAREVVNTMWFKEFGDFPKALERWRNKNPRGVASGRTPSGAGVNPAGKTVVATGVDKKTGKKVVKYSDGTIDYAP